MNLYVEIVSAARTRYHCFKVFQAKLAQPPPSPMCRKVKESTKSALENLVYVLRTLLKHHDQYSLLLRCAFDVVSNESYRWVKELFLIFVKYVR